MLNGIYSVTFTSNMRKLGTGVAALIDGKVYGGDGGYFYKGAVEPNGQGVSVQIRVERHEHRSESIFGPLTQFTLQLTGSPAGDSFALQGNVIEQPQMTISIEGRKVSDL